MNGIPLSRSAKVCWVSSFEINSNILRQLFTFKFLPYFLSLQKIFSTLPDEELLLDGAGTVSDSEFEFDIGPVPMPSERCSRLALRTVFEYSAQSMKKKIMACD